MIEMLFLLLCAHALADYPLQGDFLSKAKNRTAPIAGVPFYQALVSHSVIHGGFVYIITGFWWLGLLEIISHAIIDDLKCTNRISFNVDQSLHILCKFLWVLLASPQILEVLK